MGSCISKCRPNKSSLRECNPVVQDKLVISQAPSAPPLPLSHLLSKKEPHSPSPSSSPSFSCTTTVTTSSSCSSSTASSSILTSKDRSFSNEFLWSCVRENPHVIIPVNDHIKLSAVKTSVPIKQFPDRKVEPPSKQSIQPRHVGSIQQKRANPSSPNLARQKSFRREPERSHPPIGPLPRRNLGYSSPSRRFNGDTCRGIPKNQPKESCKHEVGFKISKAVVPTPLSARHKENLWSASPFVDVNGAAGSRFRKKETCSTHHIHQGADQDVVGQVLSDQDMSDLPIDDIDNPLISLDCFIFL